jgi:hypothetical protein
MFQWQKTKTKEKPDSRWDGMKLLGVSLFIGSVLIGAAIETDVLMGFTLRQSMRNVLNPFRVMETPEMFILFFILLFWVLDVLAELFLQKQKKT